MDYIGSELELFENAKNWKAYWASVITKYLKDDILEVGAGIGGSTSILAEKVPFKSWCCLEPDAGLATKIEEKIKKRLIPENVETVIGTLNNIPLTQKFDSIIYIDVLEHIENDKKELAKASQHLKPNGNLVVLVPAHNFLFSPFDKAIGHFRRYDRHMLKACSPKDVSLISCKYYDSMGLLTSLANKLILKQSSPTLQQISFWDTVIIPISKITDVLSINLLGKTLIGVWRKNK